MPIVISMLAIWLYGVIDTMFISQIWDNALTAVALTFPVQSIIVAIALWLGIGLNSFLAKTLWENNKGKVKLILKNWLGLTLIIWLIIAFILIFGINYFLNFFTQNEIIFDLTKKYLLIVGIFSVWIIYQIMIEKILEAYGYSKWSMIVQLSGAIINLICDPILIFWYFGCPALWILWAALSTVIGQITGMFIWIVLLLRKQIVNIKDFFCFKFDKEICKGILKVWFPTIILESVCAFVTLILNKIISETWIAIWWAYSQLQKFLMMIVYGFNYGMIPILAYNFWARNKIRIKECLKIFFKIAIVVTFIWQLVFFIFAKQLANIFLDNPETILFATTAFRILSLWFVCAWVSLVCSSVFQAFWNGKFSLVVNLCRQLIVTVPLIFIFSLFWETNGVWIAFTIAELITLFIALWLYRINKKVWCNL